MLQSLRDTFILHIKKMGAAAAEKEHSIFPVGIFSSRYL